MTSLELGRVTDRRPPFKYSALARVWFSDTDAQGVVYYGRYLPYFDHARVEYHRHLGLRPRVEGTSATYDHAAYRTEDDRLMVTATQTLVLVDPDERRSVPIPDGYREAVRAFEGEDLDA